MLPAGTEEIEIDDNSVVLSTRMLRGGQFVDQQVDIALAKTSEVSLLTDSSSEKQ